MPTAVASRVYAVHRAPPPGDATELCSAARASLRSDEVDDAVVICPGCAGGRGHRATVTVGEMRSAGCDVLATFGGEPPHFTVHVHDADLLHPVVALLRQRTRPNPSWQESR